jgi:hypothetical protein
MWGWGFNYWLKPYFADCNLCLSTEAPDAGTGNGGYLQECNIDNANEKWVLNYNGSISNSGTYGGCLLP